MKWFSFSAVTKEISKIRWPKKGDLASSSLEVIIFTVFFGLFFVLCQFIISVVLKGLGVM